MTEKPEEKQTEEKKTDAPADAPAAPADAPSPSGSLTEDDPLIGKLLSDRIKVVAAIARGGMGKIYRGEQIILNRPCAIKVLDPNLARQHGDEFAKRFLLEASVTSKLTHPNAVTIFDYGKSAAGVLFIAMEYLDGRTLASELKAAQRLPPDRVINIGRQICRALREAHALGVVHRDLKPQNIFILNKKGEDDDDVQGDFIKVIDFGLVKESHNSGDGQLTTVGQVMGSPKYMAPEQVSGEDVDARTDIYSVGVTLYELLTGQTPFDRQSDLATMMAHLSDPVPQIGALVPELLLPEGLEATVMKCLEKEPPKRFANMDELLAAFKAMEGVQYVNTAPVQIVQPPTASGGMSAMAPMLPAPEPEKPKTALYAVIAVVFLLAIVGIVVKMQSGPPPAPTVTTAPKPPPPPPSTSTPPPPPKPKATLHVVTDPPGARVLEESLERCKETPCDIVYEGAEASAMFEHMLEFRKSDYKVLKKSFSFAGDAGTVTVKMAKAN